MSMPPAGSPSPPGPQPPGPPGPRGPGPSSGRSTALWTAIAAAAVLVLIVGILVLQKLQSQPATSTATAGSQSSSIPGSPTTTTEVRPGGADGAAPEPTDPGPTNPTTDPTSTTTTTTTTTSAPTTSSTGIPTPPTDRTTPAPATSTPARATTTTGPAPTTSATSAPPLTPAEQLAAWRTESLRGLVLDGRWVIQLASKYDGVVDPRQIAANGTHTFALADIAAEITALRTDPRYAGQRFLVLNGTDFDSNRRYAAPLWITLVDPGGLSTRGATLTWCRMKNPGLDDSALLNICYPRQLQPLG